ncbi:type VI secretion system protein TssA [Biostraticola tofi]|uniref:Type VI secretion system protein ImpA n=1 Tax=Biostraticola tofi TaxID=466109 RepID=A0A4R3Z3E6_9GAMM|nr:type VI secretion system protein TssA [Biostraticola tofi]TCV98823.1 type VI secretion system protein ImpA [Biostraticola tofi]
MNHDSLLYPVSPATPCGDNLEYSAEYLELSQLACGKPEQQYGDMLIPGEPPDWRGVEHRAIGLMARSKDIRIMVLLAQAWTALHGLAGYAQGLELINEAMARYWDELIPSLSPWAEPDPYMRINALRALGDGFALARLLRQCPVVQAGAQALTVADVLKMLDGPQSVQSDYPGGAAVLAAQLRQGVDPASCLILRILAAVQQMNTLLGQRLGEAAIPEMSSLLAVLRRLAPAPEKTLSPILSDAAAAAINSPASVTAMPINSISADGEIRCREDARQALAAVQAYFAQHEPGHPAYLLIERIQQLFDLDFMQMIRNLAPDAAAQFDVILNSSASK